MDTIRDIADPETMRRRAERADPVGQMVRKVTESADPDGTFQDLARALLRNTGQETRRSLVTMLTTALGADRVRLKRYLRALAIVGEKD